MFVPRLAAVLFTAGALTVTGAGIAAATTPHAADAATSGTCTSGGMCTFGPTGVEGTFVVPAGVTSVHVVATGAPGAVGLLGGAAGRGARVTGNVAVTPGQTLYVNVGGTASTGRPQQCEPNVACVGGFNGGGSSDGASGGGGGGSDVRALPGQDDGSLSSRLVVAGGGGGSGYGFGGGCVGGAGGDGGSDGGQASTCESDPGGTGGGAGTQSSPGAGSGDGGGGGGGVYVGGQGNNPTGRWSAAGFGGGGGGSNLVPNGGIATVAGISDGPSVTITPARQGCYGITPGNVTCEYYPTGSEATLVVPEGVSNLHLVATGAPGAAAADPQNQAGYGPGGAAGRGAKVTGDVAVTPGRAVFVDVGGAANSVDGGFNGGGSTGWYGGGGGGATDLRTVPRAEDDSLASRLIVAAGGGGGGTGGYSELCDVANNGGNGGDAGSDGSPGTQYAANCPSGDVGGSAGTQTAGGAGGAAQWMVSGGSGSLGQGGSGALMRATQSGGGGGGLYGGGGGSTGAPSENPSSAGGGGGSNLVPAGGTSEVSNSLPSLIITYHGQLPTSTLAERGAPIPGGFKYVNATAAASGAPDSEKPDTIVAKGETLSQLAAEHHIAGGGAALYEANKDVLPDPDTVVAGQQLRIDEAATPPASGNSITVTVDGKSIAQRSISSFTGLTLRMSDEPTGPTLTSYDEGPQNGKLLNETRENLTVTLTRPSGKTTNQLAAGQTLALP